MHLQSLSTDVSILSPNKRFTATLTICPLNAPCISCCRSLIASLAWRKLFKVLSVNFASRVLFTLELLIAKVLKLLPRLRALIVGVFIHENRHPFRQRSFAMSIRCMSPVCHQPAPARPLRTHHACFFLCFSDFSSMKNEGIVVGPSPPCLHIGSGSCHRSLVAARRLRLLAAWYTRIHFEPVHPPAVRAPPTRELPLGGHGPGHPLRSNAPPHHYHHHHRHCSLNRYFG